MEKGKIANAVYLRLVSVFCLVAIGFMCLGAIYYHYESDRIRNEKYDEIDTIAKLKADSIQDWRRNRLSDVKRASIGFTTKREMARLLQDPTNPSARATLQILLNINKKDTVYADAFFLGTKGDILQSDNPNPPLVDQTTMKAMNLALKDRKGVLSDFFRDPKGIIYIDAIAPIPDNTGQPIAIMVLRSKVAEFLYPLIQSWPTPSKTAETLLVCREGDSVLFLNELRHRPNTALTLRFPLTDTTLPAAQAVLGKYGRFFGRDYRGVDVLAVAQPVPDSPWSIVAKVDAEEILKEVKYRAWAVSIIIFLFILISAGLIMNIYRNRREVERRKAEEALEISESKYRNLFEYAMEGIYQSTREGTFSIVNPALAKMTGYEGPEDMITSVTDIDRQFYANPEDRIRLLNTIKDSDYIENFEFLVRRKDGGVIWVLSNSRVIRDERGEIKAFEGIIQDINDRKRAEEEIQRLNAELEQRVIDRTIQLEAANRELEAFSYSVSHDLRAPLRSIDGFSQALLEEYEDKPLDNIGMTYLERVRRATQHMGWLIDDMLKLSRITQSEFNRESVALSCMVRAIAETHQKNNPDRGVDVSVQEGIMVQGDPYLMRIALENLIDNAWKFTGKEAHPRIEFGTTVREDGETACFIRDNGAGFDMAYVGKLFGAFQRLHTTDEFPGTGIGLATVQRIIHRHGGRVWAEGEPGKGATFYFTVPS